MASRNKQEERIEDEEQQMLDKQQSGARNQSDISQQSINHQFLADALTQYERNETKIREEDEEQ